MYNVKCICNIANAILKTRKIINMNTNTHTHIHTQATNNVWHTKKNNLKRVKKHKRKMDNIIFKNVIS